ncbi:MAG: SpoIIE family protein phosphatase [Actinobacteria bacterium]|nr:SpoIIE family protein phosphatase [Actinomycetota bacterium]
MNDHKAKNSQRKPIRERVEYLHSLIEASKAINSTLDLDELLEIILRIALENTNAGAGTIYLIDRDKGEVWSKISDKDERNEIRLPIGQGIAGFVAKTGETVNIENAMEHPRFTENFDKLTGFHTKSMLCMPMRNEDEQIIGVFQIMNKRGGAFDEEDEEFLSGLSIHATLAIRQAALHKESLEKRALEHEMNVAREIQENLLPQHVPEIQNYDFAATNLPAKAIGGDYYDYIILPENHLRFCIADVCGKGIPAALIMATLRTTMHFQKSDFDAASVGRLVSRINRVMFESMPLSRFVTLFYGELDLNSGNLFYVNAGHNPPYFYQADENLHQLHVGGMALGLLKETEFQVGHVQMKAGDLLFLYTDGVTEAMNSSLDEYGDERLSLFLKENRNSKAEDLINNIVADVPAHLDGMQQNDDLTMAVIKRL